MHVQFRTLSNDVVLRPVIELSPEDLGRTEYPSSKAPSGKEWLSCLEDAGISATREVVRDSWLVFADDIVAPGALRTVARAHLGSVDGPGLMSPLSESALQGGFVLMDGDEVVLAPGCCGHLGHIAAWRRAAQHRSPDPLRLSLGHPEVSATYENGLLCLHERHDEEHQNRPKTLRLAPETLGYAVDAASARVTELMTRLRSTPGSDRPRSSTRSARKPPSLNGLAAAAR